MMNMNLLYTIPQQVGKNGDKMKKPKYNFNKLEQGKVVHIKADNPESCRITAYRYAVENEILIKTWLTDKGVNILWY